MFIAVLTCWVLEWLVKQKEKINMPGMIRIFCEINWTQVSLQKREREGRGSRLKSNLDHEWYISLKVKQRRINLSLGPNYPASLVRVTVLLQDLGQSRGWAGIMIFVISCPGTSLTLLMGLKLLCMLKMPEEFLNILIPGPHSQRFWFNW